MIGVPARPALPSFPRFIRGAHAGSSVVIAREPSAERGPSDNSVRYPTQSWILLGTRWRRGQSFHWLVVFTKGRHLHCRSWSLRPVGSSPPNPEHSNPPAGSSKIEFDNSDHVWELLEVGRMNEVL